MRAVQGGVVWATTTLVVWSRGVWSECPDALSNYLVGLSSRSCPPEEVVAGLGDCEEWSEDAYCVDRNGRCVTQVEGETFECASTEGWAVYKINEASCPSRLEPLDVDDPECLWGTNESIVTDLFAERLLCGRYEFEAGDVCLMFTTNLFPECALPAFEAEYRCDGVFDTEFLRYFRVDAPGPEGDICPDALTALTDVFGCPLRPCADPELVSGEYCSDADDVCGDGADIESCRTGFDIYIVGGPTILQGDPDVQPTLLLSSALSLTPSHDEETGSSGVVPGVGVPAAAVTPSLSAKVCVWNAPAANFDTLPIGAAASECAASCVDTCQGKRLCEAACLSDCGAMGPCARCQYGGFLDNDVGVGNVQSYVVHAWEQWVEYFGAVASFGNGADLDALEYFDSNLVSVQADSDGCRLLYGAWAFVAASAPPSLQDSTTPCTGFVDLLATFLDPAYALLDSKACDFIPDFQVKTLGPVDSPDADRHVLWYARTAAFYAALADDTNHLEGHIRADYSARALFDFAVFYYNGRQSKHGAVTGLVPTSQVNLDGDLLCRGRGRDLCLGCQGVDAPVCWTFQRTRDAQQACRILKALCEKGYCSFGDGVDFNAPSST